MASNVAIQRPRVLIIGAGFGGLSAAKSLAKAPCDVVLIDRYNYHMFQPLLYQVASAALSPADIAWPIRTMFRRQPNVSVVLANVSAIDGERNEVVAEGHRIPFDYLIVATGAQQAYFGHSDWAPHAPGLKTIDDAMNFRRRILLAFEKAETEPDADERRRLLNFVVVGGGATGVELTGAIAELAKSALASDFRAIDPRSARIVLVEAGPCLLRQFDESLSRYAQRALEQLGAEVRLGTAVTGCDESGISMGSERIESRIREGFPFQRHYAAHYNSNVSPASQLAVGGAATARSEQRIRFRHHPGRTGLREPIALAAANARLAQ